MAESSSDDQNPFNCPICLHLLKDPVTTICGHSYCMKCIEEYWDRDSQKGVYSCPQCRQTFTPRPALSRSTVLAEVVERMKRAEPESVKASSLLGCAVSGDVECDVCTETKLKAIKSCLVCLASYCETHIQTHYTSSALKRHKLVNASPHLQEQICSQHDKPLELYCCQDQQLICMQCALINHQNHSIASPAVQRKEIQRQLESNQDGLQEEMHQREMKIQELRQAMESHKRSAQAAVEHSEMIFTELISSMEKRQAGITEIIRAQEKNEVRRAEELINTLEQEISDLKKRNNALGQLSHIEDDVYFIQNFSSLSRYQCSNVCSISVNQHLMFEEIQTIVSELKSQLDDLCDEDTVRISEKVPAVHIMVNNEKITEYLPSQPKTREEFLIYSTDLNLNQSSASNHLSIQNNKSVSRCDSLQNTGLGSHVNRGLYVNRIGLNRMVTYQVLCNESLSGRCYFEVQYGGTGCSIAFSYDQIQQGGTFTFGCNNRSWKFDFPKANPCVWQDNQKTNISLISKIGVFLDQKAGIVSFYNVSENMTLLHRFQTTFTGPLYPGFSLQEWGNYSSVAICDLPFTNQTEKI
ncbi:tripartite motif-containing protein 16-like isoform X2 [Myxocyprinus asiaticus]|nr:tripartite motif-containing protein 16-like isoform X2 [Myxocyprinus asiaticus]XP_051507573.1 tripartite motif-containing protein 16-like isoform X2 [Myxocyprinus asiaticus]XP_051507574.1 tripartite motif-containing protein 16-like isoform X2 [Myxocyprinus asiaticus]XP_051507575.1 tripartite motif-containing protein 16-like isoform X2 [Myxocyprinus asiaticus]